MNNLFIIGNGFDLAHELKTSYLDFMQNLIERCIKKESNIIKGISIPTVSVGRKFSLSQINTIVQSQPSCTTSLLIRRLLQNMALNNWCDIEHKYFDLLSSVKNTSNTDYRDIKTLNSDFEQLKKELISYLSTQQCKNALESYKNIFGKLANKNSLILNFNYTDTIRLYEKEISEAQIINIHGKLGDINNPIIFGYAANDEENNILIDKNDNEYLRNIKNLLTIELVMNPD